MRRHTTIGKVGWHFSSNFCSLCVLCRHCRVGGRSARVFSRSQAWRRGGGTHWRPPSTLRWSRRWTGEERQIAKSSVPPKVTRVTTLSHIGPCPLGFEMPGRSAGPDWLHCALSPDALVSFGRATIPTRYGLAPVALGPDETHAVFSATPDHLLPVSPTFFSCCAALRIPPLWPSPSPSLAVALQDESRSPIRPGEPLVD